MNTRPIASTLSLVTLSALSVGSAACTKAAAVREPSLEAASTFATPAAPSQADTPAGTCRITEPSRLVASRVFVPDGVDVRTDGGRFSIRYAERKSSCRALEATSATATFAPIDGPSACPERPATAAAFGDVATMFAEESYDDSDVPHVVLGLVSYSPAGGRWAASSGRARITRRLFQAPPGGLRGGERSPDLVALGDGKFLLLWVEGDSENREVRAEPVTAAGAVIGPAFDVSPRDVAVIGRPSAAVGADGQGVIAFMAASDDRFAVLSTPIACDSGEATQASAPAASSVRVARR